MQIAQRPAVRPAGRRGLTAVASTSTVWLAAAIAVATAAWIQRGRRDDLALAREAFDVGCRYADAVAPDLRRA